MRRAIGRLLSALNVHVLSPPTLLDPLYVSQTIVINMDVSFGICEANDVGIVHDLVVVPDATVPMDTLDLPPSVE